MYLSGVPRITAWSSLPALFATLLIYLLVPWIYGVFQVCYRREVKNRSLQPWAELILLQTVGLCLFLGVASEPSAWRVGTVALPATILFVWILTLWGRAGSVLLSALTAGTLALAILLPLRVQLGNYKQLDVPIGRVAVRETADNGTLQWVLGHTKPGDFFFNTGGTEAYMFLVASEIPDLSRR